jgi:hypothetical protein
LWIQVASLPTGRYTLAAATGKDGTIYALGGETGSGLTSEVDAYDDALNTWTQVASLPTNRSILAAATGADGTIYAIGGINAQYAITGEVDAYDPATNTWRQVASLPTPRMGLAAVAAPNGTIYALGGVLSDYSTASAEVDAYNPVTNTWTKVASLPFPRMNLSAAVGADGKIYAIGGTDGGGTLYNEVDAYDPTTNTWTQVSSASLPIATDNSAAVTAPDGNIYDIGGYASSGGITNELIALDTNPDTVVYGDVSQATSGGPLVPSDTLPPAAVTQGATAITYTGATLQAVVYPEGNATTVKLVYGTSYAPVETITQEIGGGTDPVMLSIRVTGLSPNTTYYFNVQASSAAGTTDGSQMSFTTPIPPPVTVSSVTTVPGFFKTGKGRHAKTRKVTTVQIRFSGDIAFGATDVGAYQLVSGTTKHGHTKFNKFLALSFASYNQSTDAATLIPTAKLNLSRPLQLTIVASQLVDDFDRHLGTGQNVIVRIR